MKLDNSTLKTLENFLKVGLFDEESLKDKNAYLNNDNSSL